MKETQSVHSKRRLKRRVRFVLLVLITLTSAFFIGFIVGKPYAADGKSNMQNVTEEVEPSISQDKEVNESSKQDSAEEVEIPAASDKEQTKKKILWEKWSTSHLMMALVN